jgi:hypothetical protein
VSEKPPIPPHIWKQILAWLRAGGTGKITLDAHEGQVVDAWINVRLDEDREIPTRKDVISSP